MSDPNATRDRPPEATPPTPRPHAAAPRGIYTFDEFVSIETCPLAGPPEPTPRQRRTRRRGHRPFRRGSNSNAEVAIETPGTARSAPKRWRVTLLTRAAGAVDRRHIDEDGAATPLSNTSHRVWTSPRRSDEPGTPSPELGSSRLMPSWRSDRAASSCYRPDGATSRRRPALMLCQGF